MAISYHPSHSTIFVLVYKVMHLFTGCQIIIISVVSELQREASLTCDQGVIYFHCFIFFFFC